MTAPSDIAVKAQLVEAWCYRSAAIQCLDYEKVLLWCAAFNKLLDQMLGEK